MRSFSALKSKGDHAFRQEDFLQAISYYTDALSLDTTNQEVLGCRSAVYSQLGMYNEAKKDADRLIIATPNNPKGYFMKAVALENLGNNTESLKAFLSAYERDSQHPLELVLCIIQVSGCVCQLEDEEEIDLTNEDSNNDDSKFKALVQIGKRFCKNKDYTLCNAILKTALASHCSLSKASSWLETDSSNQKIETKNTEPSSSFHGNNIAESTNRHGFSSVYLATGFHSDSNLEESQLSTEPMEKASDIDMTTLMSALITLCLSYFSLGQFQQALLYAKQCLQLSFETGSKKYELKSYVHLSNIYQKLGDYLQAISYNGKLLAIGRDLVKIDSQSCQAYWNTEEECKTLWNLSAAYKSLGDIEKALSYAKQHLEVLQTVDSVNLSVAYSNLGDLEQRMGNLESALEYHKLELRFARKFDDKVAASYAYGNIGNIHAALGSQALSEVNHSQHLKLAQSVGDELSELVAMKQYGDMYRLLGDFSQALEHYEKVLIHSKMKRLDNLQCQIYSLIGQCYWTLNQLYRAQHNYELSLKLATELMDKEEEVNSRIALAKIMKALRLYEKCRQYYNDVIPTLEHRLYAKQGNNVIYEDSIADKLADCYEDLQEVLVEMGCVKEALEICEHCNSRVLVNILRQREVLKDNGNSRSPSDLSPNTSEEIVRLVSRSDCLVLVYSRLKNGFVSWLLSPSNGVAKFHRYSNCDHVTAEDRIKSCIEDLHSNNLYNYKCDQRYLPCGDNDKSAGIDHVVKTDGTTPVGSESVPGSCFTCRFSKGNVTPLQRLHEILVEPFREQLQESSIKTLVIVPTEMLNMVPFPSLQSASGSCLYEQYNVYIMPCVRSLALDKQLQPNTLNIDSTNNTPQTIPHNSATLNKKEELTENKILVAGNPTIPHVNLDGSKWRPPGKGDLAEYEVTSLAALLGVEPVTGSLATTEHIIEMLSQSSLAHLVTYGSWKRGCLAFSPNPNCFGSPPSEDAYLVTLTDLLALDLKSKLIVISSCVSCSHKYCYLKQVNLSLATALLAAGARAVVCPLWSVEQSTLVRFYSYMYLALEKGETVSNALKSASNQVKSMDDCSDPIYWSSHIMVGFDTKVDLPKLRYNLYTQLVDQEIGSVEQTRFSIKTMENPTCKELSDKLRIMLTSLMLQHGSKPDILPSLRDVIKLANSMLAAYEEGQPLDQVVMSTNLSSQVLDAPHTRPLLLFLGFSFQTDGAKDNDPYIVFPHWDYDSLLHCCAVIFDAICSIFDISGMAGHQLARLLQSITHRNMTRLKELLSITTKYPARIVKTSDFIVRTLWCNTDIRRFLVAIGFYEVGQSLLFNKSDDNQNMVKGALQVISALLGGIKQGTSRIPLPFREISSDSSVKLVSLSPLITATNKIVMGTPWMSMRAPPNEAKVKLKFARELESINRDFSGVVTRSNYWHAQLLRAQTTQSPSLPIISQSYPPPQAGSTKKVKVVSGLTPSCNRRLVEEEPKMTLNQARERRNAIYKIYGQRFDEIAMRKRNEIRQLFVSFADQSK